MRRINCVAMLLAGGQGSRLGVLTRHLAKPAVPFGGKYRIIDFTLSNCANSGIKVVGVLTQYKPLALHSYIGIGSAWDLDRMDGGVFILPPYYHESGGEWYKGTADAIYQNWNFIEHFDPYLVLVLSGDHIYKMNYADLIAYHLQKEAEATISVLTVPWHEASRFGIMTTAADGRITAFNEKPARPDSNLASMGIYVFNAAVLKKHLDLDAHDNTSSHDFGKDVIPKMLGDGRRMFAYHFHGYWKDVGTVESLWEAHMDLLADRPALDLYDPAWRIYAKTSVRPPHYLGPGARVSRSIIGDGCQIFGEVEQSVIFPDVYIAPGAKVSQAVIMPNVKIEAGAVITKAIIGRKAIVGQDMIIGDGRTVAVVAENLAVAHGLEMIAASRETEG